MFRLGRRLASQHRPLASNLVHEPAPNTPLLLPSGRATEVTPRVHGTLPRASPYRGRLIDMSTAGISPSNLPMPRTLILGVSCSQGFPVVVKIVPNQHKNSSFSLMKNKGCNPLSSPTAGFCTSSNSGDDNGNSHPQEINSGNSQDRSSVINLGDIAPGDTQVLCQRVTAQIDAMQTKVLGFKAKYRKYIRPQLSSRCLILPGGITDPSTVFLHRQTYDIMKKYPCYSSCFDVMAYECSREDDEDDEEWERFLKHLVDRKVYVVEAWDTCLSTIEALMYDHGLKQPDDGTTEPFYKGECDAAFDSKTKIASLSYILWKDGKVIYSEVFANVECSSASDAEVYAACALLYKAEELRISKLHMCCDNKTVAAILNGEHPIHMDHPKRDFYLMLRSMRSRFKRLVVTWKPRELMLFADDLAQTVKRSGSVEGINRYNPELWGDHLRGLPVYRFERMGPTAKATGKFVRVTLDDSYGTIGDPLYFIEVEEGFKLDCLVGLGQALEPNELTVYLTNYEAKPESFKQQLKAYYRGSEGYHSGSCSIFTMRTTVKFLESKPLVVVLDYMVPKHAYFDSRAFHVVLVTPSERENMTERIPELTAMGFVCFHGVRFPLNRSKLEEKEEASSS